MPIIGERSILKCFVMWERRGRVTGCMSAASRGQIEAASAWSLTRGRPSEACHQRGWVEPQREAAIFTTDTDNLVTVVICHVRQESAGCER